MPTQTQAGKAFEFALFSALVNYLQRFQTINPVKDSVYDVARNCYHVFSDKEKYRYDLAAQVVPPHLVKLEPRLEAASSKKDILSIRLLPDIQGQKGDVRDVLAIRSLLNWEIGISAKNKHRALKHSRISRTIDFGKKWLGLQCSTKYFNEIGVIFDEIEKLRKELKYWRDVENKEEFYVRILKAFKEELILLNKSYPRIVPAKLLQYLIGRRDFYKVIKGRKSTLIQAFNLNGTLNNPAENKKPLERLSRLKLPSRIIELSFKPDSNNTLFLFLDEGWQISFRIHSASSRIENSLKFDINLIGQPQNLYSHHITWKSSN